MNFLNSKDKKRLFEQIKELYGVDFKPHSEGLIFYRKDNNLFIISGEYSGIKDSYNEGLEFGYYESEFKSNKLLLTIEGLNLVKPKKDLLELDEEDLSLFLQAKPFILEEPNLPDGDYVIKLKTNKKGFFGIAKLRNSIIHSTIPIKRRLKTDAY
ncbi:hypothetical protein J4403_01490 [Candidatus Woesearchaeota archaeon]|nr:hypothetical protein [Candidatus Woesearchaeota archaeon]